MLAIYEVLVLCSMKNDHGTGEGDVERHCHKRDLCIASNNLSIFTKKSGCGRANTCEFFMKYSM